MVVLLLFNDKLIRTVEEIQNNTNIEDEYLIQVLGGLLKNKILISEEINEDFQENDIKKDTKIQLNEKFRR